MTSQIDDVLIVGGGDVGLLIALSVHQMNPNIRIRVVDDFQRPVPPVGKSTYREIQEILHGSLNIEESRFISEVRPIWKAAVYFRNWCGRPEFHYPFDPPEKYPSKDTQNAVEHYVYLYEQTHVSPDHPTQCEAIVQQESSPWFYGSNGDLDRYDKVAYHLDTERFNTFLRKVCRERGISLVDDEVVGVETSGNRIESVRSRSERYDVDLYVDATGFNRVLRSAQDVAFREFAFPLDSALNARVNRSLADVIPATVVESGDYGWFWHIDTYDDRDLGYVYGSNYVSEEEALAEFREFVADVVPGDVDPETVVADGNADRYEFTSGYYEKAWVENCLAIGNAGGFVEPLQSTALTANASLAVRFANLLSSHGRLAEESLREVFNTSVCRTWESIHDFVAVHYRNSSGDTPFWQDVENMDVSPRIEHIKEEFDRHGYDWTVDVKDDSPLTTLKVFSQPDFYTIMRGLGVESEFYESNDFSISVDVARQQERFYEDIRSTVTNDHLTTRELYKGIMNL